MPNQPKTPARSVRVGDDLWNAAKAKAGERGETVTDVITEALRRYVKRNVRPTDAPRPTAAPSFEAEGAGQSRVRPV